MGWSNVRVTDNHFIKRFEKEYFEVPPLTQEIREDIEKTRGVLTRVGQDDPKSWFYQIPRQGKSPEYNLVSYYKKYYKNRNFKQQLEPAKRLIEQVGFSFACRIVRLYGKYGIDWCTNNLNEVRKELGAFENA